MFSYINRNSLIVFTLCSSIAAVPCAYAGAIAPPIVSQMATSEKGYFGEQFVDKFWKSSQRVPLLDKWHPNASGPDLLYRLPDGAIEVHEVKTYRGWAGHQALRTEVNGRELTQLSDGWLREWVKRVHASPASAQELKVAQAVEESIRSGRLVRVFDEVNLETGQWRISNATPIGEEAISLVERAGPMRIARIESKLAASKARYGQLNAGLAASRRATTAEALVAQPRLPVQAFETVLGVIAVPVGGIMVAEGIAEIRNGDNFNGTTHVAEGGLVSCSGVALIAGQVPLGIGLGGGAAIVDGVRDIGHGYAMGEPGRTAIGSVKVAAGGMMVVGACSGNPALVVAGTVTYVVVVGGDQVYQATQTRHANFGTADIRWRSPADCGTEWLCARDH